MDHLKQIFLEVSPIKSKNLRISKGHIKWKLKNEEKTEDNLEKIKNKLKTYP